jgi:hypothetical protein
MKRRAIYNDAPMRWLVLVLLLLAMGACKSSTGVSRDLGAACLQTSDCTSRCLPDPQFPNGFCTRDCTSDGDCPSEASCAATSDGMVCLFACGDDADCSFLNALGKTYACKTVGGKNVCTGPAAPIPDGGTRD